MSPNVMLRTTLGPIPETSRIGLGLASLGRPAYINLGHDEDLEGRISPSALEAHLHGVLGAAVDAGITYIDAARSYGRAEDVVRALRYRISTAARGSRLQVSR